MRLGQRVNDLLVQMLLLSDVSAVDSTRDTVSTANGGHTTHSENGKTLTSAYVPFHGRPLVLQYVERIERLCRAMERDVEDVRKRPAPRRHPNDTRSPQYRAERDAILREEGRDAVWVAFDYRWSQDGVRRLRQRHGLDPETGERVRRDAPTSRKVG